MNIPHYLFKRFVYRDTVWPEEVYSNWHKMNLVGPAAFTEKCLDANMMNWFIQSCDLFFPRLKEIFVDERDLDLFKQIDQAKGDRIVVVVN